MDKKYVILELIPTKVKDGDIAQLSALKIDGLKLIDRFDYRLDDEKIENIDIKKMISYDKDKFNYVSSTNDIKREFKKFIEDNDLLIIDNLYTRGYLKDYNNNIESIFKYLDMEFSDDIIDRVIDKYKLEPSNYIVDLLYEALMFEKGEENGIN